MNASYTGKTLNCYGAQLREIDEILGVHDVIEVDGVSYYTWDFGGFVVGSQTATSVDYGGNDVGRKVRTAPGSLQGMAANLRQGTFPTRIQYGEPEIVGFGHRA